MLKNRQWLQSTLNSCNFTNTYFFVNQRFADTKKARISLATTRAFKVHANQL